MSSSLVSDSMGSSKREPMYVIHKNYPVNQRKTYWFLRLLYIIMYFNCQNKKQVGERRKLGKCVEEFVALIFIFLLLWTHCPCRPYLVVSHFYFSGVWGCVLQSILLTKLIVDYLEGKAEYFTVGLSLFGPNNFLFLLFKILSLGKNYQSTLFFT